MIAVQSRAPRRLLHALVAATLAALMAGCNPPPPDQSDARLTVAATQSAGSYQPGDDISFHVTVTNVGHKDVGHVVISTTLDPAVRLKSMTCTGLGESAAHAGAADCGTYVYMLDLAAGASATLDFVTTVHSATSASISNRIDASALEGPAPVSATTQASILDTRSGTYQVFTSAGQSGTLAVAFANGSVTFDVDGAALELPFTTPLDDETYALPGGAAFRARRHLLAGTVDLGGGPQPFIAADEFASTTAELDGHAINLFGLDSPTGAPAVSRFRTLSFAGATMQACDDAAPHAISACSAGSLREYTLAVADGVFTAVDATHGDTIAFRVAKANGTLVLLRAEATSTGRAFQVGLATNAGIAAGDPYEGGDTLARWGTLSLRPPNLHESFAQPDGSVRNLDGGLGAIADAPAGLVASFLGSDASPTWLAADGGLAVVLGQTGSSQDGLLQVFLR